MQGRIFYQGINQTKEGISPAAKISYDGKCDPVVMKKSETTDALYFLISNGGVEAFLGVSDHSTKRNQKI